MSKRYYQFDNLKFFLILCVVVGHFVDLHIKSPDFKSVFIFIYTFHMPLFLFIAGMFHKNTNIAKKVVSYIILGYIYKIAIFVTRFYIYGNRDIKIYFLSETGAPWFMFAMAVFTLVSYLLRDVNKKSLFILWVLIACFTGYDSNVGTHLILSRLIVFFPFYHLGTMIKPDVLQSISSKKTHKLLALVVVIAYGLLCVVQLDRIYLLRHLFTGQNPFQAAVYPYGCVFRLLCYLITTIVSLALIVLTPPPENSGHFGVWNTNPSGLLLAYHFPLCTYRLEHRFSLFHDLRKMRFCVDFYFANLCIITQTVFFSAKIHTVKALMKDTAGSVQPNNFCGTFFTQ